MEKGKSAQIYSTKKEAKPATSETENTNDNDIQARITHLLDEQTKQAREFAQLVREQQTNERDQHLTNRNPQANAREPLATTGVR